MRERGKGYGMISRPRLSNIGVIWLAASCAAPAAAGDSRDMSRMEHFTARLVDVRHILGDGMEWVEIEFVPGAISQVETVLIRVDPWSCDRSGFLTDAGAHKFVAKRCVSGTGAASGPKGWDVKLAADEPGTYRIPIAVPHGTPIPDPPFDIVIPVSYAVSGEAEAPPKETAGVLTFHWTGRR